MKRVLIVSYFFPPATNMGSHRLLRFVRHLPRFGWEPVVLTASFEGWTLVDPTLLERVPATVTVRRIRHLDLTGLWHGWRRAAASAPHGTAPERTQSLTTFLNRWVMMPDKFFTWIGPATRAGLAESGVSAIYSTSDPLSDHLVARRIAAQTGWPWVAEFRDLWLGSPYFARAQPTPLHRAWHRRWERQVVESAQRVIGLSRGISRYFADRYAQPTATIYNCFDPAEYPTPPPPPEPQFTVLYAGALYSSRSPEPFLAGFARFVQRHPTARFVVAGGSSDLDLPAMVARHRLERHVTLLGRIPHRDALRRMQAATVLLAIQSPDDDVHVPGKLFEYFGAGRPVLAVSRPCETADLIRQYQLGWVAEPTADAVAQTLETIAAGGAPPIRAERFGVEETTRQLAAVLDEVTSQR